MSKTLDEIMEGLPIARREKIEQRSQELIREHVCRAASISHHEATIAELAKDKAFAQAYLSAAFEELDSPDASSVVALALRDVAEAYGGLEATAKKAKVSPKELGRALSPGGAPMLNVVLAILFLVDMRLSLFPL